MLVFVRHASVNCTSNGLSLLCGRYDVGVSIAGRREIDSLRRRLAAEPLFDILYTSPLRRALDTAEAAPATLAPSMRVLKSFAEIDCGLLDGVPIDDVRQRYPELWRRNEAQTDDDFAWPGGESYRRFRRRVLRAVRTIAQVHSGQRVLIVTHAGVINQVLGSISGQSAARWQNLRPRNASLTYVLWGLDGGTVVCFDDCAHLKLVAQSIDRHGG